METIGSSFVDVVAPGSAVEDFRSFLFRRFPGGLSAGAHDENGDACVLEAWSAYRGVPWTDNPDVLDIIDLRVLNDMDVSRDVRTLWMPQLAVAYAESKNWSLDRIVAVGERLVFLTVQRLIWRIPELEMLQDAMNRQHVILEAMKRMQITHETGAQNRVALDTLAVVVSTVVEAVALVTEMPHDIFVRACELWLDAAQESAVQGGFSGKG